MALRIMDIIILNKILQNNGESKFMLYIFFVLIVLKILI
jgi:hypothetical protein